MYSRSRISVTQSTYQGINEAPIFINETIDRKNRPLTFAQWGFVFYGRLSFFTLAANQHSKTVSRCAKNTFATQTDFCGGDQYPTPHFYCNRTCSTLARSKKQSIAPPTHPIGILPCNTPIDANFSADCRAVVAHQHPAATIATHRHRNCKNRHSPTEHHRDTATHRHADSNAHTHIFRNQRLGICPFAAISKR